MRLALPCPQSRPTSGSKPRDRAVGHRSTEVERHADHGGRFCHHTVVGTAEGEPEGRVDGRKPLAGTGLIGMRHDQSVGRHLVANEGQVVGTDVTLDRRLLGQRRGRDVVDAPHLTLNRPAKSRTKGPALVELVTIARPPRREGSTRSSVKYPAVDP